MGDRDLRGVIEEVFNEPVRVRRQPVRDLDLQGRGRGYAEVFLREVAFPDVAVDDPGERGAAVRRRDREVLLRLALDPEPQERDVLCSLVRDRDGLLDVEPFIGDSDGDGLAISYYSGVREGAGGNRQPATR